MSREFLASLDSVPYISLYLGCARMLPILVGSLEDMVRTERQGREATPRGILETRLMCRIGEGGSE